MYNLNSKLCCRPSCYTSSRGKITGANLVRGNERSRERYPAQQPTQLFKGPQRYWTQSLYFSILNFEYISFMLKFRNHKNFQFHGLTKYLNHVASLCSFSFFLFFLKEDLNPTNFDLLCSFLQILQVLYFPSAESKMISNLLRCRFFPQGTVSSNPLFLYVYFSCALLLSLIA